MNVRDQRGFTLIEIIMATFVLIIGMGMMSSIFTGILNTNFLTQRHTQAVILAQNKIEELLFAGYTSPLVNDGSYQNPLNPTNETGDSAGVFYQFWAVEDVNPIEKAKLITSTVEWEDADGTARQVILAAVCIDESN